jgi:hypothetical protein
LVLNQDFQDFEDYLALGVGWSFESGFSGFRGFLSLGRWVGWFPPQLLNHFFFLYPFNREDNRVLSCIMVLNQDFQDFEDFSVLGVGWDGACSSIKLMKISAFLFADAIIAATKYYGSDTFPISNILNQRRHL